MAVSMNLHAYWVTLQTNNSAIYKRKDFAGFTVCIQWTTAGCIIQSMLQQDSPIPSAKINNMQIRRDRRKEVIRCVVGCRVERGPRKFHLWTAVGLACIRFYLNTLPTLHLLCLHPLLSPACMFNQRLWHAFINSNVTSMIFQLHWNMNNFGILHW